MTTFRRLTVLASIALVAVFGEVAQAAASAQGPTAGTYRSSGVGASFGYIPSDNSVPQINISVDRSINVSNPLSGPSTSAAETDLNLSVFDGSTFSYGCFVIDPSAFNISSDLASASVDATVTDSTPTCGLTGSMTLPLTVDVAWTGVGPLNSRHTTSKSDCGSFHTESLNNSSGNPATATATLSPTISGSFDSNVGTALSSGDNLTHVEGTAAPLCMVGGAPAEPGPLPAGTYRNASLGASQQLVDPATGTFLQVTASTITAAANPMIGPSTSTTQTKVSVSLNGSDVNGFGCFVVTDPGAFALSKDLSSASLHTTLTEANAPCGPFPNDFTALPLTVDVTWTGIGPSASARSSSQSTCPTFRMESSDLQLNNNSSAVAALSGAVNESFVSQQSPFESTGSLGSEDTTSHSEGVETRGCG